MKVGVKFKLDFFNSCSQLNCLLIVIILCYPGGDPGGGVLQNFLQKGVQPLTRGNLYRKQTKLISKGGGMDLPLLSPNLVGCENHRSGYTE